MSSDKTHLFAFRTDEVLADLLESEGNKSEVINRALLEYYRRNHTVTCPTCKGSGQVYNPPKTDVKQVRIEDNRSKPVTLKRRDAAHS